MKAKFLIVFIAAILAAGGAMAVTLPGTSYSPYANGDNTGADNSVYYGMKMPSKSFLSLSTAERTDNCTKDAETDPQGDACASCCDNYYGNGSTIEGACAESDWDCWDARGACMDACRTELSPIEGGEWFMILLAALLAVTCCIRYLTFNINNKANQ